jgi:hypothetical protein
VSKGEYQEKHRHGTRQLHVHGIQSGYTFPQLCEIACPIPILHNGSIIVLDALKHIMSKRCVLMILLAEVVRKSTLCTLGFALL